MNWRNWWPNVRARVAILVGLAEMRWRLRHLPKFTPAQLEEFWPRHPNLPNKPLSSEEISRLIASIKDGIGTSR
jgi:hypothetical protein